jgi:very-short-patch-repair endonuclease
LDKAYDRLPTARSRELRTHATAAERLLWRKISNRQLAGARFNRQVPIGPFICDFVCRSLKLVIELDGGQHALSTDKDGQRTAYLERQGYHVLRFWNNDVLGNVDGVITVIEMALRDRPSPNPSRRAGGEFS